MKDQKNTFTSKTSAVINAEKVVFCIDSNILVEFPSLDSLRWRDLAPNAMEVHIIVPTKVAEEMDAHKKRTGRLRRRGIEFAKIARAIEESPKLQIEISTKNPLVVVGIGAIFRKSELDGDLFDLEDSDGRLVAEIAAIVNQIPNAVFLSDDSKPIRIAMQTGLAHTRPPESWRREDGPDERDLQIAELKRELGAQPELVLSFPDAVDESRVHVLEPPPTDVCVGCFAGLVEAALSVDRKVPHEETIRRYGLENPNSLRIPTYSVFSDGVSEESLQEYDQDYRAFERQVRKWAELIPELMVAPGLLLPIEIEVANEGDRAAERVHIEVEAKGDFFFAPLDVVDRQVSQFIEPPDPPSPTSFLLTPDVSGLEMHERRRSDAFYPQDRPSNFKPTDFVSWRCEELRQGARHTLVALVVARQAPSKGALAVRASSAVIAKSCDVTVPLIANLEPTETRLASYLLRRLDVLPEKYQEKILDALTAHREQCPQR